MIHCNGKYCVYNTEGICHKPEAPNVRVCLKTNSGMAGTVRGPIQEAWICDRWDCANYRKLKSISPTKGYCDKEDIRRVYPDGCIDFKK